MKLIAFFVFVACVHVHAAGYGQGITLSEKEVPLDKVFKEIRRQSGYQFFYSDAALAGARKVTIEVNGASIEEVLKKCFAGQPLEYTIKDRTIVVRKKVVEQKSVTVADSRDLPIDITGRVTDAEGKPLSGANVKVKGTTIGTVTDINGNFTLPGVDANAVLEVSFVGYAPFTVSVRGNSNVVIALQQKTSVLDETVVIAYGTSTKRLNTGNISSVSGSEIERQPVSNPLLALQGRVPGLFITQSSGMPGTGVKLQIQGKNSIQQSNDPLYVIDGVPYASQMLSELGAGIIGTSGYTQGGNPLNYINPADIESISVLKDADATAIYGSRAANGAVLITTKKGKAGKMQVNVNAQHGWGKVSRKIDMMNTQQYVTMRKEALKNDGIAEPAASDYDINGYWDSTAYTDWQKELIGGTAHYSNINASVSGGSENVQYLVGTTYRRESTVFPGDFNDQKGSVHFSFKGISLNQKFQVQITGNYLVDKNFLPSADLTNAAINTPPNAPKLYNEDGTLNWAPDVNGNSTWINGNPVASTVRKYQTEVDNVIANAVLSYKLMPGLELLSNFAYTNLQSSEVLTSPFASYAPEWRPFLTRMTNFVNGRIRTWNIEPQLSFKRNFGSGKINVLLGGTMQQTRSNNTDLTGNGFNSDLVLEDIGSAGTVSINSTFQSLYKYNALFGRVNFTWRDKYILNLNARRDGSSRFGTANRFHNFGSVGGAWIFSEEEAIKDGFHFLTYGKLRASYGTTGNDQIGDYIFQSLYTPTVSDVSYQGVQGLQPIRLTNPYLQWEETRKLNVGLDLTFFNDRIVLNTNYYRNRSSNQLLPYRLSAVTGFTNILTNFPAEVQNTGWEFTLMTDNIKGEDFTWKTSANLTIPRNKLIDFPNLETSSYSRSLLIGEPINILRRYHYMGVDPTTGLHQFQGKDGNLTSSPSGLTDNFITVNTAPRFYGGFENSFTYKNFELNILFQFTKQIGQNFPFGTSMLPGASFLNQPVELVNRWQKQGDITNIQRYNSDYAVFQPWLDAAYSSDAAYVDASFIRLKNVSLAYQFPQAMLRKVHIQQARLFVQAQNLLTITNYTGMDPETLNLAALPTLRVITAGVGIGF